MTTKKHPRDLTADQADAIVAGFDDHDDDVGSPVPGSFRLPVGRSGRNA